MSEDLYAREDNPEIAIGIDSRKKKVIMMFKTPAAAFMFDGDQAITAGEELIRLGKWLNENINKIPVEQQE